MKINKAALRFKWKDQLAFYFTYVISKTLWIWFDCRSPKLSLFLYEMLYSLGKVIRFPLQTKVKLGFDRVDTKFGRYKIRPDTLDAACASPAYERRDVDALMNVLDAAMAKGQSILFLDVGAEFGVYAVAAGNRLRGYQKSRILAFEPAANSFALLKHNIGLNGLDDKIVAANVALGDEVDGVLELFYDAAAPGRSGLLVENGTSRKLVSETVRTSTLDAFIDDVSRYDLTILKIDVEGYEARVLRGAKGFLERQFVVILLVEDFVNEEIVAYLRDSGMLFKNKLTPYNSWWRLDG